MNRTDLLGVVETGLLVAIGGAAGANLRYAVGLVLPGLRGTFVANVTGSFLLALLLYEASDVDALSVETRLLVGTGFLSSFTTYSTFALETAQSPLPLALLNVVGSYALGFAAVLVGRWVVGALAGPDPGGAGGGD